MHGRFIGQMVKDWDAVFHSDGWPTWDVRRVWTLRGFDDNFMLV